MKTQTETVIKKQRVPKATRFINSFSVNKFRVANPEYRHVTNKQFSSFMVKFFELIGQTVVENDHGLILSGVGYFANGVKESQKIYMTYKDIFINDDDKKDIYRCSFYPQLFNNRMASVWNFRIRKHLALKMATKIRRGKKYKCHSHILKKIDNNGRINIFGKTY